MKTDADEFYTFDGDAEFGKPPYWVARHGLIVTSQIGTREVEGVTCTDVATARAAFADGTCDPIVGAPQAGDTIRIHWGPGAKPANFYVGAAEATATGWRVTVAGCLRDLVFGQFTIISRPTEV